MKEFLQLFLVVAIFVNCIGQSANGAEINVSGKLRGNTDLDGSVASVAFSPDGKLLASAFNVLVGASPYISKKSGQGGNLEGNVVLWDVHTKEQKNLFPCTGMVYCVSFSPDGKLLAAAHAEEDGRKKIRLLEGPTWRDRYSITIEKDKEFSRSISTMTFSPDGKKLIVSITGYPKGPELAIFDSETGLQKNTLKGGETSVPTLSFSADGKLLTSISEYVVKVWDMPFEKERNSFSVGRGNLAAMSPDGSMIAVSTIGSRNYSGKVALALHNANTGKELLDFKCLRAGTTLLFTPDGKNILYGYGGIVNLFEVSSGKRVVVVDGPHFSSMAITRKGDLIATGNNSGTIWLWKIGNLK